MKQLSKKQKKRMKHLRNRMWKLVVICLLINLFMVVFFLNGIYANIPLSQRQVTTISGDVEYAYARDPVHRQNSLVVKINDQTYTLLWWGDFEELERYSDYLSTTKPYATIMRMTQPPIFGKVEGNGDTVAISDDRFSFDFSEEIDTKMHRQKRICIIIGVIVGLIALPLQVLYIDVSCGGEFRELKRLKKKSDAANGYKTRDGSLS